ncbi:MAG: hypothetical protein M1839_000830 [Geoglossum umbratile]|nr:MAG: hypothetical protein M1839_000830 [Geoglossum umbratile]
MTIIARPIWPSVVLAAFAHKSLEDDFGIYLTQSAAQQKLDGQQTRLSLEEKNYAEQVAKVVDAYIDRSVCKLAEDNHYNELDESLQEKVHGRMRQKANGTFLWVSLVTKSLEKVGSLDVLKVIEDTPSGLINLYEQMLNRTQALEGEGPKRCRLILSTVTTAKEPLRLE